MQKKKKETKRKMSVIQVILITFNHRCDISNRNDDDDDYDVKMM